VFVGVSQNVKQGTKLKMSTEGFDMGRFEYFDIIVHLVAIPKVTVLERCLQCSAVQSTVYAACVCLSICLLTHLFCIRMAEQFLSPPGSMVVLLLLHPFNSLSRSTRRSRPNNIRGGNVRPSVGTSGRMSVRTSVHKKFVRFQ